MALMWQILIGVVVAGAIYWLIHRQLVQRATRIVRRSAQETTDVAMTAALQRLLAAGWFDVTTAFVGPSTTVADVWGRGVMAFEYQLVGDLNSVQRRAMLRQDLEQALASYTTDHQVTSVVPGSAFAVTDLWVYEGRIHIDVAYLMNQSTVEYLKDLKKLDGHN